MVKNTICEGCAHVQVCGLRNEFNAAVAAINCATYEFNGSTITFKDSQIEASVFCPHFLGKVNYR